MATYPAVGLVDFVDKHGESSSRNSLNQRTSSLRSDHFETSVGLHEALRQVPLSHAKTAPAINQSKTSQNDQNTPNALFPNEESHSSPEPAEAVTVRQTWKNPSINRFRLVSCCFIFVANGMNDSAPGALLPYIEDFYHINYITVSTIFISNAIGFILAALFVNLIDRKLGRARTMMLNEAIVVAGYVCMALAPPFAAFAVAFFVTGFGIAVTLALNNVFCANLANPTVPLSILHGCYGIGGLIAPIIVTSMVTKGIRFSQFFFITLGIRALNIIFSGSMFWNFERDLETTQESTLMASTELGAELGNLSAPSNQTARSAYKSSKGVLAAITDKHTLVASLFIFAYQGAEVSISGWVISFLITTRNADPAQVGYVTAGFWGGITFGRLILNNVAIKYGEKLFVYLLIAGAVCFQFVVWFAPNIIADSIATAIIGVLLGPLYPCAVTVFARLLPRRTQSTAMAFISSAGSSGGAVAPFLTGLLAQARGTYVLHPICIALFILMEACWWFLTKDYVKRKE